MQEDNLQSDQKGRNRFSLRRMLLFITVLLVVVASFVQVALSQSDLPTDARPIYLPWIRVDDAGGTIPNPTPTTLPVNAATPTTTASNPTPMPTPANLADYPLCPDHDINAWHALIDYERQCHYDHEHKDDPRLVDDLFGPVGVLYGGQEISYPWQTFNHMGTEQEMKHGGYGWMVRRDMACYSQFTDGCITDFRAQYHAIMGAIGATTRFHSFVLEARGCLESNPNQCGTIKTGGWIDYGMLEIDGEVVPLVGDPANYNDGKRRIHYFNTGNANFGTWYGHNNIAVVVPQTADMWGYVDPDNPTELHLFCPEFDCENNGSILQAHEVGFQIPPQWDTDRDGIVNYSGYTDRHGVIVQGCTEVALDCVPLEIVNMPVGVFRYRDDVNVFGNGIEYDTSPRGHYWIKYPN